MDGLFCMSWEHRSAEETLYMFDSAFHREEEWEGFVDSYRPPPYIINREPIMSFGIGASLTGEQPIEVLSYYQHQQLHGLLSKCHNTMLTRPCAQGMRWLAVWCMLALCNPASLACRGVFIRYSSQYGTDALVPARCAMARAWPGL